MDSLAASRHHASELPRRLHHGAAFANCQRFRFLAVDIFARPAGGNGDDRVPVIRRGDMDGVDIRTCQQFPEITIGHTAVVPVVLIDTSL